MLKTLRQKFQVVGTSVFLNWLCLELFGYLPNIINILNHLQQYKP